MKNLLAIVSVTVLVLGNVSAFAARGSSNANTATTTSSSIKAKGTSVIVDMKGSVFHHGKCLPGMPCMGK